MNRLQFDKAKYHVQAEGTEEKLLYFYIPWPTPVFLCHSRRGYNNICTQARVITSFILQCRIGCIMAQILCIAQLLVPSAQVYIVHLCLKVVHICPYEEASNHVLVLGSFIPKYFCHQGLHFPPSQRPC